MRIYILTARQVYYISLIHTKTHIRTPKEKCYSSSLSECLGGSGMK